MVGQPAKVGRGLRSIAINISKLAQENEYFEAANGKVKVALQDSNGEMRSTYDIMADLASKWGSLNETEQTSIATTIAGKTQFEVFANVMKNWATAADVVTKANKANGSSIRENEKYLDSIEGKIQAFQSAWEQLSYHVMSSDFIKGVISFGTQVIKILDEIVQGVGALPALLSIIGTAFGALKLNKVVKEFLGLSKAIEGVAVAEGAMEGASSATLLSSLGKLGSALLPLAPALIALGGAFIYANHQYKNSFKGKLKEYEELGNKIEDIQSQIEALEGKEGELTSEEQSRLSILKMQLEILKQQEALKSKQLTNAFNQDAKEKMHGKTHMVQGEAVTEREDLAGDKYIKAAEKRFELQKKIKHLEDEQRMHPLTVEQTKQLEDYNKELDKVYTNEYEALDKVLEEQEALANVDYSKLNADAKAWYDNTHSAYLQASSDIEDVRKAVGEAIDTFGSAQFDAWNIDVSSLKSASELADKINEKIAELGENEDITIYAHDEAGNIIDEITHKKSELTDDEWELVVNATTTGDYEELAKYAEGGTSENNEVLISFIPIGLEKIKGEKSEATSDAVSILTYNDNGTIGQIQVSKIQAIDPAKGTITFDDNGTTKTIKTDKIDAAKNVSGSITFTSNIGSILSNIRAAIAEKSKLAGHATGKRKGEKGGLSWLGDEGSKGNPKPELVVGEDGAYLAGTGGWELYNLRTSDTVYTASQTKKLLSDEDFDIAGVELPRFKKGKKGKKKTKKQTKQQKRKSVQKKASKKTKEKWEKEFNKKLDELQYKAKANHWTDAKYQAEYKKLYNKYYNKATTAQLREYVESREDYENEVALKDFDRRLGNLAVRGAEETRLANFVKDVKASTDLSADEKKEQLEKAYKNVAEYNLKAYENGKATRDKTLQSINDYYKQVGKKDEDYYKMLDDLREADQKKEVERLKKLEEQEENKLSLAQKYLNKELKAIEKQIDAQKEEKEAQEKLVELQNELNKAKSTSIRIYKEGVGFVYEQDTEAIKEAQKAYDDYLDSQNKTDLEKRAEEIRAVLELFGDLEDASEIHELELKLGVNGINSLTGGNFGTNISQWTSWIKSVIANQVAYADLGNKIGDLKGADIDKWLGNVLSGGAHQVSSSTMLSYILQHSFASGTLSAPGGLSRINELGGELVWLGKGDSVYSNRVSRNLMEWGKYNPAQVLSSNHNSSSSQIFNFDKIVLPNVRNAEDFYRELQKLPNMAIQQSARR